MNLGATCKMFRALMLGQKHKSKWNMGQFIALFAKYNVVLYTMLYSLSCDS